MGDFMGYMVQVSIIMTILYIVYKLLMSGTSFHSFNRKIILGIYAVSWILPSLSGLFSQASSQPSLAEIGPLEITSVIAADTVPVKKFDWINAIAVIYFLGILIMAVMTVLSIRRMASMINKARRIESAEYAVMVSDKAPGPYSWGKYIVVRPSDIDESLGLVISHESAHLRKLHWIDLIPSRITVILQWFSPAAWLLARELRDVHEFEVDEIAAGENIYEYQLMLIKKTAGHRFPVFADSLNHSQIKKRLTMMRKISNPKRRGVAIALPLAACGAVVLLSQPVIARVVDRLGSAELPMFTFHKGNENDQNLQIIGRSDDSVPKKSTPLSVDASKSDLAISKDDENRYEMFGRNDHSDTEEKTIDASKLTYFVDGKEYNGSISDIEPSTIASMQIVKNDPAYPDFKVMITTKQTDSSNDNKHDAVEKIAQFKGGERELLSFLIENIKYPDSEMESPDKTVRVILSFNILTDGSVDDIKVRKSGGSAFDAEAIEVVKKTSGRWEPAEENGKPVVSQFTIPITFKSKA